MGGVLVLLVDCAAIFIPTPISTSTPVPSPSPLSGGSGCCTEDQAERWDFHLGTPYRATGRRQSIFMFSLPELARWCAACLEPVGVRAELVEPLASRKWDFSRHFESPFLLTNSGTKICCSDLNGLGYKCVAMEGKKRGPKGSCHCLISLCEMVLTHSSRCTVSPQSLFALHTVAGFECMITLGQDRSISSSPRHHSVDCQEICCIQLHICLSKLVHTLLFCHPHPAPRIVNAVL